MDGLKRRLHLRFNMDVPKLLKPCLHMAALNHVLHLDGLNRAHPRPMMFSTGKEYS